MNRAYDWVAEAEHRRLRATRRARRMAIKAWLRSHRGVVMIVTWMALLGLGFCLGLLTGGGY